MYFKTFILIIFSFSFFPSFLHGFDFTVQEGGEIKTVSIPEHTQITLENNYFRVLPKSGTPIQSTNDKFEGTNTSEKNQVQAYYLALKSYENLRIMFDEAPSEFLIVYVDDIIYENPNNALFVHEDNQAKILLGKGDNLIFKPLSQSADYITHEMAHFFMDNYFDSHRGEAGVLQEGLSDFFVYMSGDSQFGNDARIDGKSVRSAESTGQFDDPTNPQTIHQLGEYLSAVLYTLSKEIGKETTISITVSSIKELKEEQTIKKFFINLENQIEEENYCRYESSIIAHGFIQYLQNQDSDCGQDLEQLKTLSMNRYQFDVANLDLSFIDNAKDESTAACGQITKKHPTSYPSLLLLVLLPLLIASFYREENYEY